ncbi:MAG: hypothetical protein AB7P40_11485 [Chloroflexota bacterium]
MRHRLAVLMLTSSLVGLAAMMPLADTVQAQATPPGLVIAPVSGTLALGGQFTGQVTITRLSYRAGQLSADGLILGTMTAATAPAGEFEPDSSASATAMIEATGASLPPADSLTLTHTPTPSATLTATPDGLPAANQDAAVTPAPDTEFRRAHLLGAPAAQPVSVTQAFRDVPLTVMDPNMGVCDVLHLDLGPVFVDQAGVLLDLAPASLDMATLPRANRPVGNMLCAVSSLLEGAPSTGQTATLNELLPVINRALGTPPRR